MCSAPPTAAAKTAIRDEALRLFADRGFDAVSVRDIAAGAGVSPALVLHHWGSKEGLRTGVNEHVDHVMSLLLDAVTNDLASPSTASDATGHASEVSETPELASLTHALLGHLPPSSPVPSYLRRLLLSSDPSGVALVRRWHHASMHVLTQMTEAGLLRPGIRPQVRAAVLLANDLAVLMLRDSLEKILGEDPLGPAGLAHWTEEVQDLYEYGLMAAPRSDDAP